MKTQKAKKILVVFFLAAVFLPGAGILLDSVKGSATVSGGQAQKVTGAGAVSRIREHVGGYHRFLNSLRLAHNLIMLRGIKGFSRKNVVVGNGGWVYWAGGNSFDQYTTAQPLSDEALLRIKTILEERQSFCRLYGMRYLFVVVPNKDTIYPEFLPEWLRKVRAKSNLDQIVEYLRNFSTVEFIDLRGPLRSFPTDGLFPRDTAVYTYFKVDTHWNDLGGFAGYREIMKRLTGWFPGMSSIPASNYRIEPYVSDGGDTALILGINGRLRINEYRLVPRRPLKARTVPVGGDFYASRLANKTKYQGALCAMETNDASLPRGVMFRDSMSIAMLPHLAEHFQRLVLFWVDYSVDEYDFNAELVRHEKAVVVISEMGERKLMELRDNPPEVRLALKAP